MRTAAWETAPQIALRDCSKEAGGEGKDSIYVIWVKGVHTVKHINFFRKFLLVL